MPGGDLVALHPVGELRERLAGKRGEEPHARELGHAGRDVAGAQRARAEGGCRGTAVRYPAWASSTAGDTALAARPRSPVPRVASSAPRAASSTGPTRRRRCPRSSSTIAPRPARPPGSRARRGALGHARRLPRGGRAPAGRLRRELREETGLDVEPGPFVGAFIDTYGGGTTPRRSSTSSGRRPPGRREPTAADDVTELRWFARDDLPPDAEIAFRWLAPSLRAWAAKA